MYFRFTSLVVASLLSLVAITAHAADGFLTSSVPGIPPVPIVSKDNDQRLLFDKSAVSVVVLVYQSTDSQLLLNPLTDLVGLESQNFPATVRFVAMDLADSWTKGQYDEFIDSKHEHPAPCLAQITKIGKSKARKKEFLEVPVYFSDQVPVALPEAGKVTEWIRGNLTAVGHSIEPKTFNLKEVQKYTQEENPVTETSVLLIVFFNRKIDRTAKVIQKLEQEWAISELAFPGLKCRCIDTDTPWGQEMFKNLVRKEEHRKDLTQLLHVPVRVQGELMYDNLIFPKIKLENANASLDCGWIAEHLKAASSNQAADLNTNTGSTASVVTANSSSTVVQSEAPRIDTSKK